VVPVVLVVLAWFWACQCVAALAVLAVLVVLAWCLEWW
jgi:hypothetical protein